MLCRRARQVQRWAGVDCFLHSRSLELCVCVCVCDISEWQQPAADGGWCREECDRERKCYVDQNEVKVATARVDGDLRSGPLAGGGCDHTSPLIFVTFRSGVLAHVAVAPEPLA